MKFPEHDASLHLVHNDHKSNYLTVKQAVEMEDHGTRDWVSEEQKQKAIETNDFWYVQWYPKTPVGFCIMAAADLDVLLAAVADGVT